MVSNHLRKLKNIKKKYKYKFKKKYGVKSAAQAECVKIKIKNTCKQRYGAENVYASEYGKQKIKETCLNKYGVEYYVQTEEFKEKVRQNDLKKYGVKWHSQFEEIKQKTKETNLKRYGVENVYASECIKEKSKQTCIEKYGKEYYTQTDEYRERVKKFNLEHYGVEHYAQTEECKEKTRLTCFKKYNVDNPSKYKPIIDKIYNTKKRNKTINSSKSEEKIAELLMLKFNDVKRQYKSEKYPFACDFYIPELDLYIEYQGIIDHGHHNGKPLGPYNENDLKHQQILKLWQEKAINHSRYISMIKVWTIRDPLKRKIAKENNLNWLEFFTMKEFMIWYNSI